MSGSPGAEGPFRVAIVGAGPAGFFLAERLLAREGGRVEVDLYERLPAPYGLVRFGVAPDHEKIKSVTRAFDAVARRPGFRYFGNVEFGADVTLADFARHYHQVCFTTGAQTDRKMGIPGEDLLRSHPATEFVAWYNGHPRFRHLSFDLSVERVAVVGVGNVAVDVARILCRTSEELARTDIADYALDALRRSRIREVYLLGRRGPVQAAFTTPEARELGELAGADVCARPDEVAVDPWSQAELMRSQDRTLAKKVELLREFSTRARTGKPKLLTLRFLVSPVELHGDASGRVVGMRLVRNALVKEQSGALRAAPMGWFEELPVELVFRSVGYRGVPLPGVPFDEKSGTIPNARGRVLHPTTRHPMPGLYVAGWIKRGPSGVIGTNKPDAAETAEAMLGDLGRGEVLQPTEPTAAAVERLLRERVPCLITFEDWKKLDAIESERGKSGGRPRVKMSEAEMLKKLGCE
ncbi:MAG TPA: FAD-dependent oxidoreductase [Gemmatimonadales bacterium]|nr:FAD-dependent oxidoreductase [Gemmatimonadales bacterium]